MTPLSKTFDVRVFAALAKDLGHTAAMSFLMAFISLLTPRITRIRRAFKRKEPEEIVVALSSLRASSAMTGAEQLHATTTRALSADPIEDQPFEPIIEQLTSEAEDFTEAVQSFASRQQTPEP